MTGNKIGQYTVKMIKGSDPFAKGTVPFAFHCQNISKDTEGSCIAALRYLLFLVYFIQ